MAAAVLLRSVARKMSRAAASTHHRCLVARGLHGGAQQGTADVLVSSGMAAATGLGSAAGRLTTKMAHAPPPPPYHRLVHCRGIHSRRTSPDPIPSTPRKVPALVEDISDVACIALVSAAIFMHFWVRPHLDEVTAMYEDLLKETRSQLGNIKNMDASSGHGNKTQKGTGVIDNLLGKEEEAVKEMHSQKNHVKELEATIMDLKAENAKLKIALDSARSQGKV
ncbi:uncharacterized protein LOC110435764 isoform X2 [Sorghum bicolor]|uniref:uncharacterized protein LOC110435764 isoform X2 n=1 Tax=Sorghum bicolor TaxID=4558 RepID=UPI000B424AD3|nr:uncharacterized protein LOC110435764 isoform X2 [Sorghum bicolor]|eukprot:XP_021317476.1 uncharacterized protein LOC110435764 isoform X2 [Sorghum bicolor]